MFGDFYIGCARALGACILSLSDLSFYCTALRIDQVQAFFREISKATPNILPGINAFYKRASHGRPWEDDNWMVLIKIEVITPDTAKIIDDVALGFWFKSRWELRDDQQYLVIYGPNARAN